MLEYSKMILKKVSFDSELFQKELIKSLKYLRPNEVENLLSWVRIHYQQYADILNEIQKILLR